MKVTNHGLKGRQLQKEDLNIPAQRNRLSDELETVGPDFGNRCFPVFGNRFWAGGNHHPMNDGSHLPRSKSVETGN